MAPCILNLGTVWCILNFGTGWRSEVDITPQLL